MDRFRLAVDIGGTFTDLFFVNEDTGEERVSKVSSQSDALSAVLLGIERAGVSVPSIRLLSHGTTVATNALITRNFPRTAMVTTKGFRDVIEIGRGTKDETGRSPCCKYILLAHRKKIFGLIAVTLL